MMGIIVANNDWAMATREMAQVHGNVSGPDDLYLAQRGLRTMAVRMEQNQKNGIELATWLEGRPEVKQVLHPALPSNPGHEIWKRDFSGASGLFSFILKENYQRAALAAMLDGLELYGMGASWGGFESLAVYTDPVELGKRRYFKFEKNEHLVRLHIGLEDPKDLINDLRSALRYVK